MTDPKFRLLVATSALLAIAAYLPACSCGSDGGGEEMDTDGSTTDEPGTSSTTGDPTGDPTTGGMDLPPEGMFEILSVQADPPNFMEGDVDEVDLEVTYSLAPTMQGWSQQRGPRTNEPGAGMGNMDGTVHTFTLDVSELDVAVDTEFEYVIEASRDGVTDSETVTLAALAADMEPTLGEGVQIGGASTSVVQFDYDGAPWALYNIGNHLHAIPIGFSQDLYEINVPHYVRDMEVVQYGERTIALVAMGPGGLTAIDITDPTQMTLAVAPVTVNYLAEQITFAEGGGTLVTADFAGENGSVESIETDGTTLWIGNTNYGLHRTALDNLLGATPALEDDGTLLIEHEAYVLQYAGEHGWGGPTDIDLVNGRLFVAMGELGLGIYDPTTLERVGYYNLYTDTSMHEDWFVDMDVTTQVSSDVGGPFLDPVTGMPDYRQANYEIEQVWKEGVDAPTPWAEFDRYGKFYYGARRVVVADQGPPTRTIAYIAYALGGVVAVDVTGYETADTGANFLTPTYLGYAPAVPAHGPEEPSGTDSRSLYPYYGAGMLKEAGVVDVAIDGDTLYYTDHFAGLVVLEGADRPDMNWHGPNAPYNNDNPNLGDGVLGDHWPDYEFVTSYDMSQFDPLDRDSLPIWVQDSPSLLATGEVSGHGNRLVLTETIDTAMTGNVDVVQCAGAGGLNFLDIDDFAAPLMPDRFNLLAHFATTDEIGAAPDGSPTAEISIGHTQGMSANDNYLYVADGPHGVSAWQIKDDDGAVLDQIRLVANTIPSEDPVDVGGTTIFPAHHSLGAIYDPERDVVWSMSQSLGVRRIDVAGVEAGNGMIGAPLLLPLAETDLFEHNGLFGVVEEVSGQDHAYDLKFDGDLAYVADGSNGLTVYDVTKDPTNINSGFVVSNFGGEKQQRPPLGRAIAIELWQEPGNNGRRIAFMAAGQRGVAVVDVSDPTAPSFIKVFEPIKYEEDSIVKADSRAVDVHILGDNVVYSYSGFGVIVYTIEDLLEPLPAGVDPTEIWKRSGSGMTEFDYRPETISEFRLDETEEYAGIDGESLYMEYTDVGGRQVFYVAYGNAGVIRLDLTDPTAPVLMEVANTVGEATAVAMSNGRLFVADGSGGIALFK